ncbi:MAG: flagellar export protein FliJ [Pirellula sp.]|jgi:flagellar export protein FliJ|nr:flagellar export protein FliJ [Pirellula sp.]
MAKFRLATLLRLRERERDRASKEVQDAIMAIEKINTAKQGLLAQSEQMNAIRKQFSTGNVEMRQLLDAQKFQMLLLTQVQQLDQTLGELRQELQRRELKLLRCQQNVKSLEKLREHRDEEAERLLWSKQQERTDEWASVRFATNIQSDEPNEMS